MGRLADELRDHRAVREQRENARLVQRSAELQVELGAMAAVLTEVGQQWMAAPAPSIDVARRRMRIQVQLAERTIAAQRDALRQMHALERMAPTIAPGGHTAAARGQGSATSTDPR